MKFCTRCCPTVAPAVRKATPGQPTIEQLIWHPSDLSIKPIVGNRRIERLPEPKWDAAALPFESKARFIAMSAVLAKQCLRQGSLRSVVALPELCAETSSTSGKSRSCCFSTAPCLCTRHCLSQVLDIPSCLSSCPGLRPASIHRHYLHRSQSLEAMMELGPGEKEEFLTEIYKALASISTLRDKVTCS